MTSVLVQVTDASIEMEDGPTIEMPGGGVSTRATYIRNVPISAAVPAVGEALVYDGTSYTPTPVATAAGMDALTVMLNNHLSDVANPHAVTKAQVGLALVENTALSTWGGSANITTIGALGGLTVTGSALVGSSTSVFAGGVAPRLQIHHTGNLAQFTVYRWSADASGPSMSAVKSRSTVIGTFAAVQAGDVVMNVTGYVDDGTDANTVGWRIRGVVAASPVVSTDRVPTDIEMQVASGLSNNSVATKAWLRSTGVFQVGHTDTQPSAGALVEYFGNTGTSALIPVIDRRRTIASGNNWLFGVTNFWSASDNWSDDTSSPGASVRTRISTHAENINGSAHGMGIWVGPVGGIALSVTLNSDLSVLFAGAVTVTGAATFGNADTRFNQALVALGGGAAPTLGTIGGSGPATAAQNSWKKFVDSTGAAFFVPAWK